MTNTSGSVSTGKSIQNPTTYYCSSSRDWNSTTYYDYWNATNGTTTSMNDNKVVKTVYDPNPVGFKMPSPDAFTGFTQDGGHHSQSENSYWNVESTTFNNGWNFYTQGWKTDPTDFWRANGYRGYSSGSVFHVGSAGLYGSAGPKSKTHDYGLSFVSSGVTPQYGDYRVSGFSVRPVTDTEE